MSSAVPRYSSAAENKQIVHELSGGRPPPH